VPEETTPESSDGTLESRDALSSPTPATPTYSSRREMRAALEAESRRPAQRSNDKAAKAAAAKVDSVVPAQPANIVPAIVVPAAAANVVPAKLTAATAAKATRGTPTVKPVIARTAKPTRVERSAARRLTAPERTPAVFVAPSQKKKQKPAVVLLTLLIVPGFLASATLPAFAFAPAGSEHQAEIEETANAIDAAALPEQEVAVGATVTGASVTRDAITATSEAELAEKKAQELAAAALAAYQAAGTSQGTVSGTVSGVRAAGDDYPWPAASDTLSPLNYYYRQCVDFVAWRLNRDAGSYSAPFKYVWSNMTPSGGNASAWKSAWERNGWTTSDTPVIGSVAWFNGNHVAYVKEIVGSNVVIEEYNGMAKRAYAIRTIPITSVAKYLYPPPR
jgi:surface antigen